MLRLTGKVFGVVAILVVFATLVFYFTAPVYTLRGIPVLNYHQVNDEKFSPLTMKTSDFRNQMAYLQEQGYHAITMEELYGYLQNNLPLPSKPVVITFDDGYVDNYTEAMPILKEAGITAKIIRMEPYKDPDEFIKNLGTEAFEERINKARNGFLFSLEILEKSMI